MSSPGFAEVKHVPVNQAMRNYLVRSCSPPDPAVRMLAERTAGVGDAAGMMVPVEQVALLTILAKLQSATTVVDVGTFTGLSALALALGLAPGGRVITCDVTDKWVDIAREHWEHAGVADRIDFRLGPAGRTLRELPADTAADIVFIDADKMNYPNYYELAVPLLRTGGLLVADNVLLDGYVLDPELADSTLQRKCAETLRVFNAALAGDDRFDTVMLPIADGLTVARKK
ncbi:MULTISPECIES: O-methyltransferase [Streptosporangium]|uniref:Caffeoyl-CoA O-methyltransferase n=1 Tax=Streptosporangium brasiliense TaxID=47480 RepID=A0ABT9RPJ8_9ACTN|nr:O-methyltransferase [Streptosporangium brasiliense]MDP9870280.1 caffeoyl-CoA O-methyltransferase [Streptosporangium brasiliense]